MRHVDFIKLDNAVKYLTKKNEFFEDKKNQNTLTDNKKMMLSNGLYINRVYSDTENDDNDQIHQINIDAIKDAIKKAVDQQTSQNKPTDHIEITTNTILEDEKQNLVVSPSICYSNGSASKNNLLSVEDIMGLDQHNQYRKNYFFDGEKPFVIYNYLHEAIATKIYAAGITNIVEIIKNNIFFRNVVHLSPKCVEAKKLAKEDFKISFDNKFDLSYNGHCISVSQMPLCEECCKIINIPNLSQNADFVAMFGLAVSIST